MELKNPYVVDPEHYPYFDFANPQETDFKTENFFTLPEVCFFQPRTLYGALDLNPNKNSVVPNVTEKAFPDNIQSKQPKKELSKTELFKCKKCEKTYLSYPALYTHNKLKHQQSEEAPSSINGRIRGRPRKIIVNLLL